MKLIDLIGGGVCRSESIFGQSVLLPADLIERKREGSGKNRGLRLPASPVSISETTTVKQ